MSALRIVLASLLSLGLAAGAAAQEAALKLGVLKFGTVEWELDVIKHHGLDTREGFNLEIMGFAGGEASNVALMAGEVDCIVDDYLWVARMRADGADIAYAFPYSSSVGALVARKDSAMDSLDDLAGRRLGVAGGAYDKSWLLVRAIARKRHGIDLATVATLAYGAPPLLSEKFASGELDAVLTYWHFVSRLEAAGHPVLLEVADAQAELGMTKDVPQLGYVCRGEVLAKKPDVVRAFAAASRAAKAILAGDDAEWQRLRPLTKAENDAVFEVLVRRYRSGIVKHWGDEERAQAAKLFAILAELGGEELVGKAKVLPEGTFWDGVRY